MPLYNYAENPLQTLQTQISQRIVIPQLQKVTFELGRG